MSDTLDALEALNVAALDLAGQIARLLERERREAAMVRQTNTSVCGVCGGLGQISADRDTPYEKLLTCWACHGYGG